MKTLALSLLLISQTFVSLGHASETTLIVGEDAHQLYQALSELAQVETSVDSTSIETQTLECHSYAVSTQETGIACSFQDVIAGHGVEVLEAPALKLYTVLKIAGAIVHDTPASTSLVTQRVSCFSHYSGDLFHTCEIEQ